MDHLQSFKDFYLLFKNTFFRKSLNLKKNRKFYSFVCLHCFPEFVDIQVTRGIKLMTHTYRKRQEDIAEIYVPIFSFFSTQTDSWIISFFSTSTIVCP